MPSETGRRAKDKPPRQPSEGPTTSTRDDPDDTSARDATVVSETFGVSNGVKQGGVLSPILFAVYIDELLIKLRSSGVGCYIGNTFLGAFGYADDIILICPTIRALKVMLSIAQNYTDSFDIKFNISKSLLVAYNKHGMMKCAVNFNNVTQEHKLST